MSIFLVGGDGIAQRKRSMFTTRCPGFESSDCWEKKQNNFALRACHLRYLKIIVQFGLGSFIGF